MTTRTRSSARLQLQPKAAVSRAASFALGRRAGGRAAAAAAQSKSKSTSQPNFALGRGRAAAGSAMLPHQLQAADFLGRNRNGSVMMFMEMGSGKSAALGACIRTANIDAVVVVPAIVADSMCAELRAWLGFELLEDEAPPRSTKYALRLPKGCARERRAYIVTHNSFSNFMESPLGRRIIAKGQFLLAYDESQALRNVGSFHKTLRLFEFAQSARNVVLMTGTPMYTDVVDVFPQLFILGALDAPYDELTNDCAQRFAEDVERDANAVLGTGLRNRMKRRGIAIFYHRNDPAAFARYKTVVHAHRPTDSMTKRFRVAFARMMPPEERERERAALDVGRPSTPTWGIEAVAALCAKQLRRFCREGGLAAVGPRAALALRLLGTPTAPKKAEARAKTKKKEGGGGDVYTELKLTSNMSGGRPGTKLLAMCEHVSRLPAKSLPALVFAPYGHMEAKYGGVQLLVRLIEEGNSRLRVRALCGTTSNEDRAALMEDYRRGDVDVIVTNLTEGYSLTCRVPGSRGGGCARCRAVRQVHVASPTATPGEFDQLRARGNRLYSHAHLDEIDREIEVHQWVTCHESDDALLRRLYDGHEHDPCVSFEFESARSDVGPAMMTGAVPKTYDMAVNKTHHDRRCRMNAALQALSRASHHA